MNYIREKPRRIGEENHGWTRMDADKINEKERFLLPCRQPKSLGPFPTLISNFLSEFIRVYPWFEIFPLPVVGTLIGNRRTDERTNRRTLPSDDR